MDRAESADLKILIADSSLHSDILYHPPTKSADLQSLSKILLGQGTGASSLGLTEQATDVFDRDSTIIVMNKTDLLEVESMQRHTELDGVPVCWISCKTGDGVETFMDTMKLLLQKLYA